jgi:hypothetical protein
LKSSIKNHNIENQIDQYKKANSLSKSKDEQKKNVLDEQTKEQLIKEIYEENILVASWIDDL